MDSSWIVALGNGQIRKHIGTYVGENKLLEEMVLKGTVELELNPQGHFRSAFAQVVPVFPPSSPRLVTEP